MISLDLQSRQPIYEQVIQRLTELISFGAIPPEEQLPSVRSLARDLGVNPNTVQKAYQELERTGVIYSVAGKGSFISPGNGAAELVCQRSITRLREAAEEGKRTGLSHERARKVVDLVYEEGAIE